MATRFTKVLLPLVVVVSTAFTQCKKQVEPEPLATFDIVEARVGTTDLDLDNTTVNTPVNQPIVIVFNQALNTGTVANNITLHLSGNPVETNISFLDQNKTVSLLHDDLLFNTTYTLTISGGLRDIHGNQFEGKILTFTTEQTSMHVDSLFFGSVNVTDIATPQNIAYNYSAIVHFDQPVNPSTINAANIRVFKNSGDASLNYSLSADSLVLTVTSTTPLEHFDRYRFFLSSNIQSASGAPLSPINKLFYTAVDPTPKFPVISDDELLTRVQEQTFKYFWDFGHPVSGLARERNTSGDIVTSGGSGFGVMAIIVGIERGFITRAQGVERWSTIVNFLGNQAQRFHGAWPHWLNGTTGQAIAFSAQDNGADLVETSFLIAGLLTVRQYLNPANATENQIIQNINALWEAVEWDWFTQGGQNVLYWHWSPNFGWAMNHPIRGYNECLITYFLAAASPTHPISPSVYHNGWTNSSYFLNGNSYYNIPLPLGFPYGGPMFFAHYSFVALNPTNLTDNYANYWTQNVNHTRINRAYCIDNPLNKIGYSEQCWGLTASDNYQGYSAHSPTNDLGVITPTAALSSLPYTPEESMEALRFFYYTIGDKTWGPHGFYDAFSTTEGWYGNSYLAIDQGPIIIMLENHRTSLLWDLFMTCPEVNVGMNLLGFSN